ncbi:retinitis pigmentosa 1-like 1 protein isoform X2 [Micropterus salmoides]|nr:retinitis pigmentosa 1-like 1 protein isoform X2 [Micropterus salmoides]
MLHVELSQSLYFGAFTVLDFHTLVLLATIHSCRAQSNVIGPSKPILAMVGEDITLPCYLDPVMDAFSMTLEWARPDLDPRFVLVWRDDVELESKKHGSYQGRTSLFSDELKKGNISLKLSKVKISDAGRYRCFVPALRTDSTVQLVVGAVSSPGIQKSKNSSSVVLQCESAGWYPEPEVFWLDGEGNLLSAGPTETVRGPDDLYTLSSRVTVEKRHSNSFTCRVQQKDINQIRETHIQVPDDFFPGRSDSSSSSSAPAIIGLIVAMLVLSAVFVIVWKWRQNKIRNKKHLEDEETQKVREKKSNSVRNNSEQEPLMERETDREQLAAERERINIQDPLNEETELQAQTKDPHQRESNNVLIQTQENIESVNKETEHQSSVGGRRQTDQAEGQTENGLDKGQEETETQPINQKRDAPHPAESDLNHEEEAKPESDNTEQLMEERETDQAEGQTENGLDKGQEETETQPINQKRDAPHPAESDLNHEEETKPESDNTEQLMEERETDQAEGQTENGLDKGQEETETQPINQKRDAPHPAESDLNHEKEAKPESDNTEQLMEEREKDQAEGQTENGLDKGQEETETQPINQKRDAPHPAESDLNHEEEAKPESDNTEQLMEEREKDQAEGQTENGLDKGQEETETQPINQKRDAPHPAESDLNHEEEAKPESDNTEQLMEERETDQAEGQTENGLDKGQEETETQPINQKRDAPHPAESDLNHEEEAKPESDNTEQLMEEEEGEEIKSAGDETQAQCLMEEEKHGEQLMPERETLNDLDKEKEKLMRKLKTKDREQKKFEEKNSRLKGQMETKEKQMQQLKVQLEEVERQRGEAERKLQSVNREEDKMEEAAEKDEAVRLLLDTKNDLETKKTELQKQLEKMETIMERQKKDERVTRQKKMKAANEKEEIIKKLKEMEKQTNETLQERKTDGHREDNMQEAADDEDL